MNNLFPLPGLESEALNEQSYQTILPEARMLQPGDILPINLDIYTAVPTALGSLRNVLSLRDALTRELPLFDLAWLDKLETSARALMHAHTVYTTAMLPTDLSAAISEAVKARKLLRADVSTLCTRGILSPGPLREYKGSHGHRTVASDLQILTRVLRTNWNSVKGRCATGFDEVERAEKVAIQILRTLGLRDQTPNEVSEAVDIRVRVFTLFVTSYDEVRRAVNYLRWKHGDADRIAPSLYAKRTRTRSKRTKRQGAEPTVPTILNAPGMVPAGSKTLPN